MISVPFVFSSCREYDEAEAIATVHEALKQGINYIDTAPWYGQGHSEELLGKVMISPCGGKFWRFRIMHNIEFELRKRNDSSSAL
jgi:predicted aldo/keto reductase-like oxidoreductase